MKEKPKIKCPVIDIQPFSYRPLYCTVVEDDGISKRCGSLFISYFFTLSTGTGHRRANGTSFFLFKDKSIAWGLCFDWINYISFYYWWRWLLIWFTDSTQCATNSVYIGFITFLSNALRRMFLYCGTNRELHEQRGAPFCKDVILYCAQWSLHYNHSSDTGFLCSTSKACNGRNVQ